MTVFLNSNQTQKDIKVLNLISKYLYFIEYLVFFFFGVFYAKVSNQANYIAHFINEHIKLVETKSYFDTFSYCLLVCCTLVLVCLFFAFTLYGKYVLHILFSYVSLLLGIATASLYKIYLFSGFVGFVHYLLPFSILLVLFGVLTFYKAGEFSGLLLKKLKGEQVDLKIKNFCLFFVFISLLFIILSLIFALYIKLI